MYQSISQKHCATLVLLYKTSQPRQLRQGSVYSGLQSLRENPCCQGGMVARARVSSIFQYRKHAAERTGSGLRQYILKAHVQLCTSSSNASLFKASHMNFLGVWVCQNLACNWALLHGTTPVDHSMTKWEYKEFEIHGLGLSLASYDVCSVSPIICVPTCLFYPLQLLISINMGHGWVWWHLPLVPAFERQRQEKLYQFEARLVYIVSLRPVKDT